MDFVWPYLFFFFLWSRFILDSCWFVLTRVGLMLTRVGLVLILFTRVGLLLIRIDWCWVVLILVYYNRLDLGTQHHSKTSLDHKKEKKAMAKQNPYVNYQWCFVEKTCEGCVCQWFKFFSPIYFQLYQKVLLFYTNIYSIQHRAIVICSNYYATDSHFIKSCILKPRMRL